MTEVSLGPSDPQRYKASNGGEFAHDPIEARLSLKTDAGAVRERNRTALNFGIIGKTTRNQ